MLTRSRHGRALIVIPAYLVSLVLTCLVGGHVSDKFGALPGLLFGVLGGAASLVLFYWLAACFDASDLKRVREKYRFIYRVVAVPSEPGTILKPEGAEVRVGDYGWEAWPLRKDGLIYLQGLTRDWSVVWHAGFRPEQIELVGKKPESQFDYWIPYWATPSSTSCPFPVEERETLTMGLPNHSHGYFTRHTLYRPKGEECSAAAAQSECANRNGGS